MKEQNREPVLPTPPLDGEGLVDFDQLDIQLDQVLKEAYPPIAPPLDLSEKVLKAVPLSQASEPLATAFSGWLSFAAAAASVAVAFILWDNNSSSLLNSDDINRLNAIVSYEQLDFESPREGISDEVFFDETVVVDLGAVVGDLEYVLNLIEQDIGEVR